MELNLAWVLDAIAAEVPDRECLVWGDRRVPWSDLVARSNRLANLLVAAGLGIHGDPSDGPPWSSPHDHLALYLTNGHPYLEATAAGAKARVVPINVNYRYVAEELRYVFEDAAVRGVIFNARYAPMLADVLHGLAVPPALLLQVADESGNELLDGASDYEEALAGAPQSTPLPVPTPDDRYIIYTGGTTGMPKGVVWRQGDFVAECLGLRRRTGEDYGSPTEVAERAARLGPGIRALPAGPLMHGAALWNALAAWVSGGTIVLQDHPERFDAADVLATIERESCTSLQVVGDSFVRPIVTEARRGGYDLGSLRQLVSSGAALSSEMRSAIGELVPGIRVVDIVGSSESGRLAVGDPAGTFLPSSSTRVLSEDRQRVLSEGEAEVGWLAQRGRLPCGYLGDRAKTEQTFPELGGVRYVVAGDRARIAADGSIQLLGRDSATINSGGEKVFAEEVEGAMKHHPQVRDVLVVGRPSQRWGQEVVALVEVEEDAEVSDDELLLVAAAHVARYKLPREIVRVDGVRRTPSGKPDYRWARALVSAPLANADPGSR